MHSDGFVTMRDGAQIYQQRWRPAGPVRAALALVHGLGEHSGRYSNLVPALLERGYALYSMDNRGHGRSPGPRGFVQRWAVLREDLRFLVQLMAANEPGLPLFLMGHSLGGLIAFDYALHYPGGLRGLVLSAPGLSTAGISPALMALSTILSRLWPTLAVPTGLDQSAISRDPQVIAAYRDDPLVHSTGTPRLATEGSATIAWVVAHAHELSMPVLMLHGAADRIVPPAATRAVFETIGSADKRYLSYPDMYHEPHNDRGWQQPVQDIGDWLDQHL